MNAQSKNCLILTAVAALVVALVSSSSAQSYLDGSAKARGDYGQMNRSSSQPMFRSVAPSNVRSYSYEPAPAVKTDKSDKTDKAKGDSNKTKSNVAPKANAAPNTTTRSYSYEPSRETSNSSRSSSTPLYLVPKALR